MFKLKFLPLQTLVLLFVLNIGAQQAMAQRLRAETDLLREEAVRTELGLTGERATEMEELLKNTTPGRDFFEPYLKRIGDTKDREEQSQIRAEMNAAVKAKSEEMKASALDILSDAQKQKLRGIFLRSTGPQAFSDPRVAKEYALTEEQSAKLVELAAEFRTANRALDDPSDEDREKFNTEWKNKFLSVLTPEQKSRYDTESRYGELPAVAAVDAPSTPGTAQGDGPPNMNQPPPGEEATGSFGGGIPGESQRVSEFRFNFRYESWERVLQMYADGAGLTLDLNQIPPGTFSHYDDNAYTARQTLDILNGYLHRKGFAMVENDGFLIVLNTDNGIAPYLIRDVTEEQLLKVGKELEVGNNELANFRMSVDGMDTGKVAQEVEAVLGPLGSMVALTDSQLLIITDVGANLRRIHGFLTAAMSKSKPDALIFQAYHLKNMDAEEAEIQVMTQFGMRQNVANVSASTEQSRSRFQAPQPPSRNAAPAAPLAAATTEPAIQIASDLRLNSLLVTGTAKQHQLVAMILDALDVNEAPDGSPLTRGRKGTYLEVYQVKSADSGEVTKTLGAMNIPGVQVVNEDRRTGRVHIMATERQHLEVASLIRQLDGGGVSGAVAVIPLAQMDPLSAAATLRSLFFADGDEAPTFETDLYGRRLIVRGSIDQITQVKQVLADLGEDGTGVRDRGEGGLVRRFSLQGRNPEQFLQVLQQQWDSQQETKINIVIPNDSGPIRSRRTPEEEFEGPDERANERPRDDVGEPLSYRTRRTALETESGWIKWKKPKNPVAPRAVSQTTQPNTAAGNWRFATNQVIADEAATDPSGPDPVEGDQPDGQRSTPRRPWTPENRGGDRVRNNLDSDVFVQLLGDDLILSASDETQLDELEDLLDFLHQTLPMKPEYTVVYLKAADALEAADMLSQFFPSSSVATTSIASSSSMLGSLGSSFSGMGSSLMDMTGLSGLGVNSSTLKIIPDIRTNSLFLTGPQSMIRDALAFLKVLDSNDIPESLKDMQPRQIMVTYADVNDVAALLRDVFKPYMEAQGGGKNQQNPLAMMFGGGGGSGRGGDNEATQIRMTLGVDAQTSVLTVNCSQDIFEEVEQVVQGMDLAARAARPIVLPIQLKNADAVLIQQMLGSLVPRVSVTSSRTNTSNSSNNSSSSGGGSSGGNNNPAIQAQQEAINREIQNRIRERIQQSGGGGQGGGFPGGGRGFGTQGGGRGPGGRTR